MEEDLEVLKNEIRNIAKIGFFGTIQEYYKWHIFFYNKKVNFRNFVKVFHELINNKEFVNNQNLAFEYIYNYSFQFNNYEEYVAPTSLDYSPIQFVRSRLISFLKFFHVDEEIIHDIIIATVEAIENAVKYSNEDQMNVKYYIDNDNFHIEIRNKYQAPIIEKDIETGKYNSSRTLMRGMLVMSKLFDEMDINLVDNNTTAVFKAKKRIKS